MQTVLGCLADPNGHRLPAVDGAVHYIAAAICSQLFARIGTKPVVLAGT
jgi:hypothetical protein